MTGTDLSPYEGKREKVQRALLDRPGGWIIANFAFGQVACVCSLFRLFALQLLDKLVEDNPMHTRKPWLYSLANGSTDSER